MAGADFTIADVLAWARTKPADEEYIFTDSRNCALCQFLRETGRAKKPGVLPDSWWDNEGPYEPRKVSYELNKALNAGLTRWTFGDLVERLEKLCPETVVTPSEWTKLDAYLTDIEQVSA